MDKLPSLPSEYVVDKTTKFDDASVAKEVEGGENEGTAAASGVTRPTPRRSLTPIVSKQKSWTVQLKQASVVIDPAQKVSMGIIDYSSSKLERIDGEVSSCGDALLDSSRPGWASVRWMNLDVNLEHPAHEQLVNYLLKRQLGEHAAKLAMESILASGQRARYQIFGDVFFLIAKIPSLPDAFAGGNEGITRLRDELCDGDAAIGIIEFELIVFTVDPTNRTLTTIQNGKEGDVWDSLRGSLRANDRGHHDVRNRSVWLLLWNLLSDALRECDKIDECFGAIIAPMLSYFEMGTQQSVTSDDRRIARFMKSEFKAFSRQVLPLRDVFSAMAEFPANMTSPDVAMYFVDLRDRSLRIIDNIVDNADDTARLLDALHTCDDRRDAKVQFSISVTLAVFSPLSFVVGFYGMNFVGECPEGVVPGENGVYACPGGIDELYWPGGYYYLWCLIVSVSLGAIVSFWSCGIISMPRCSSRFDRRKAVMRESAAAASAEAATVGRRLSRRGSRIYLHESNGGEARA